MKGFIIAIIIIPLIPILFVIGQANRWFSGAVNVAQKEFSAQTLLDKYEWFKDASAQLDKKQADIKVYGARNAQTKATYGSDASKWPRDVREQNALWQTELAGIIASYNTLAADYNSQMSKFNYRFTNVGDLPQGATTPLPREYKPYQETL